MDDVNLRATVVFVLLLHSHDVYSFVHYNLFVAPFLILDHGFAQRSDEIFGAIGLFNPPTQTAFSIFLLNTRVLLCKLPPVLPKLVS